MPMRWIWYLVLFLWSLSCIAMTSDAGWPLFAEIFLLGSAAGLLFLWIFRVVLTFSSDALASVAGARRRRAWAQVGAECLFIIGVTVACLFGVPFAARFALSEASLQAYARQVAKTEKIPPLPRRVGLFRILETEALPEGAVRMITCEAGLLDRAGIACSPGKEPPVMGEDYYNPIDGTWWRWHRSW